MEILLDEPINLEQVADLCAIGMKRKPPTPRDFEKWHVSNLLNAGHEITRGNIVYPEYEGKILGIMSMGSIWETVIDIYLTHYAVQQGGFYTPDVESVKDDILGSLDGLMWLPELGWMVCETKLRFTLNGDIPGKHLQQVLAYCYLADTDLVCYVSGHLSSRPPTAEARMRIMRFTGQGIEENWQGIANTKACLEEHGIVASESGK